MSGSSSPLTPVPHSSLSLHRNAGLFNFMLSRYVALFPQIYPGSTTSLFDTVPFFDAIIDNPYEYGFTDSKDVCPDYVNVRDDPLVNLNTCPWPFSQ